MPLTIVNTARTEPIESRLVEVVTKYHFDQQGRAPKIVRAHLSSDMVVVYSSGIFTPTEESLAGTDEGRKLIKSARRELRSISRKEVEAQIAAIVGCPVLRSFWDLDVRSAEQVEIYMLARSFDSASAVTVV